MNVLDLFAKLSLDSSEYDEGLEASEKKASGFGSKLKAGLSVAAKATGIALTAASGAAVAMTKQAVDGYASYEQLVGGIETLFGAGGKSLEEYAREQNLSIESAVDGYNALLSAQDAMLSNADRAFKTAGMSANEYMETAIQSGAAMISSVGGDTAEAARLMDMSVTDMSDNVNKMGTTMEAVQNAYRGFSRGNFTMLDNLALGFAGTKDGMVELLDRAEKLSGVKFDIESYADIVQAIHIVQEDMGITGTTAKEASETISGSLASMKSAVQNLLTGMADPASDTTQLINNVVDGAETAFENILPAAERALVSGGTVIERLAPIIVKKLPGLIQTILPSVLNVAGSLVSSLISALPNILRALVNVAPEILLTIFDEIGIGDVVRNFMEQVSGPLADAWERIKTSVTDAFYRIREAFSPLSEAFSEYISSGEAAETATTIVATAVNLLADGISAVAGFVATVVEKGAEFIGWLNEGSTGAEAFKAVITGVVAALAAYKAVTLAIEVAQKAQLVATEGVTAAQKLLNLVMSANPIGLIIAGITALVAAFIYLWNNCEEFREFWINLWNGIKEFAVGAWEGIKSTFAAIGDWFKEKFTAAKDGILNAWSNIKEKFEAKREQIKSVFSNTKEWFATKFGDARDSVVNAWSNIKGKMSDVWSRIKSGFSISDALTWGKDMIKNFIDGIKQKWEDLKSKISGIGSMIKDFLGFSEPKKGPLSNFHTFAPDMMDLFIRGVRDNTKRLQNQVAKSFDFESLMTSPVPQVAMASRSVAYVGMQTGAFGGGEVVLNITNELDGAVLSRKMYRYNADETKRHGDQLVNY